MFAIFSSVPFYRWLLLPNPMMEQRGEKGIERMGGSSINRSVDNGHEEEEER